MSIEEKLKSIKDSIAVNISRRLDQYGNLFYTVTDLSVDNEWKYEGRGYRLEIAIDDFIKDLKVYENKAKYANRNRTKEEIDEEIADIETYEECTLHNNYTKLHVNGEDIDLSGYAIEMQDNNDIMLRRVV